MILTLKSKNRYMIYCKTGKYIEDILIDDRLSIVRDLLNRAYNSSYSTVDGILMSKPFIIKDTSLFISIKLSDYYHIRFLYKKNPVWFATDEELIYCCTIKEELIRGKLFDKEWDLYTMVDKGWDIYDINPKEQG